MRESERSAVDCLAAVFAQGVSRAPQNGTERRRAGISTAGIAPRAGQRGASCRGSTLCVSLDDPTRRDPPATGYLRDDRALGAPSTDYYARFPAPLVELRVRAGERRAAASAAARTTNEAGLVIQVSVGREVTAMKWRRTA